MRVDLRRDGTRAAPARRSLFLTSKRSLASVLMGTALVFANTPAEAQPAHVLINNLSYEVPGGRGIGWAAAAGDLDGDGAKELLIGSPNGSPASVTAVDPRTGEVQWVATGGEKFGEQVVFLSGSQRGVAIGERYSVPPPAWLPRAGAVHFLDSDGAEVATVWGNRTGELFGTAIVQLDDDRVAIGAPGLFRSTTLLRGRVDIYSRSQGRVVRSIDAPEVNDGFGANLSGLGDVDGDGWGDFVAGAEAAGHVYVMSSRTGAILARVSGQGHAFGRTVAVIGPAQGSSAPRIAIAESSPSAVRVYRYEQENLYGRFQLLYSIVGSDASFGDSISRIDDLIAIGAPSERNDARQQSQAGAVYFYRDGQTQPVHVIRGKYSSDHLGSVTVALDGGLVGIGAPGHYNRGRMSVYSLAGPTYAFSTACISGFQETAVMPPLELRGGVLRAGQEAVFSGSGLPAGVLVSVWVDPIGRDFERQAWRSVGNCSFGLDPRTVVSSPVMQVAGDGTWQLRFPLPGDPRLATINDVRARAVYFRQTPT
ncbi:MAG: hypothetical protein KDD44_08205, partial [Bdellovibrionales bacterium]|nr:hypothetical protein [Bdellovibrionales bacterium]